MSVWLTWAEAAEATWLGQRIAESTVMFPALEGVHLLGLALSVGLIALTDLRLLGWLLRDVPADAVLAFGTERDGLSDELKQRADAVLALPMEPGVSSLNLATSVAATLYALKLSA